MPQVHLTDAEAQYLYELVDDVVALNIFGGDKRLGELDFMAVSALATKLGDIAIEGKGGHDRRCLNCGALITSPNPRKVTCSDACRQAWSRKLRQAKTNRHTVPG